jgi:hypothetical protein
MFRGCRRVHFICNVRNVNAFLARLTLQRARRAPILELGSRHPTRVKTLCFDSSEAHTSSSKQSTTERTRFDNDRMDQMEQRLLQEQLARLRGSWRNENHQQNKHAAKELSTSGGSVAAPFPMNGVVDPLHAGIDRQWLALRQKEVRATDRRNQQLLREHHCYQQQLRELTYGSVPQHQQRYYPPATPPGPFSTPAPVIVCAASTRTSAPKRSAPPPPYYQDAPGEPLGKKPCLATPSSSWSCREQEWELLVEQGRRQAGPQPEQRNAVRQLNQMWQAGPLAFAQLVRTPVGKLFLPPPEVYLMPPRRVSTLKEKFAQHVMCRYTPMRPSEFQLSLWVSSGQLINLLQPHAPTEVQQLGPQKLTQLIIEWYKDHPAYKDLAFSSWCAAVTSAHATLSPTLPWPQPYSCTFSP